MKRVLFGLAVVACLATPVLAQDSVSKAYFDTDPNTHGLPGDALDPWTTGPISFQSQSYVVDLTPFTSSWGTSFAIAPVLKSGKNSTTFFNTLLSAQSISRLQLQQVPLGGPYAVWDPNTPGAGIHPTNNVTPNQTLPQGSGNQFAVAMSEFGSTPSRYNGIVGGVVRYDPANPNRLYVKRVVAAISGCDDTHDVSQFGVGAVDEHANVIFRADNSGSTGGCNLTTIATNGIFQVDLTARNPILTNIISDAGLSDVTAGNTVFRAALAADTYNTPNLGPTAIFTDPPKPGPFYLGTNFNKEFARGAVDGAPAVVHDLTQFAPGQSDTRGSLAYMSKNFTSAFPGSTCGTAAMLAYRTGGTKADTITMWGLDGAATPKSPTLFTLPATITDASESQVFTTAGIGFDGYHGQTGFRGGNSQVALNVDQAGRLLAAGTVWTALPGIEFIAVARLTPTGTNTYTTEWSVAAYTGDATLNPTNGKPIYAGPTGAAIGHLTPLTFSGGLLNPGMSCPMIDSVGNVWFTAMAQLWGPDGIPNTTDDFYDVSLIRAVYNPATFSYRLEDVLGEYSTFTSVDTGLRYRISYVSLTNTGGSGIDSATTWSQNISEKAFKGGDPAPTLATSAPDGLGGLVLSAKIIYDVNGDGLFKEPDVDERGADPTSPDEAYNVLLYVSANPPTGPTVLCGDANCDGLVNNGDIDAFIQAITNTPQYLHDHPGCPLANSDTNEDTLVNNGDIDAFISVITGGPGCGH